MQKKAILVGFLAQIGPPENLHEALLTTRHEHPKLGLFKQRNPQRKNTNSVILLLLKFP